MAGNYPDPPGPRLAWDIDGSQSYRLNTSRSGIDSTHSQAVMTSLNGDTFTFQESSGTGQVVRNWGIMFPELRDLVGFLTNTGTNGYAPSISTWQWSADTTNMADGVWTTVAGITRSNSTKIATRNEIRALNLTGVKAIRWWTNNEYYNSLNAAHIYGKPTAAASNRLEFWHPTVDATLNNYPAHLDWGNRPQGSTATKQVRVKNLSTTLTANSIVVDLAEPSGAASPTMDSQHTLALGAGAAGATVTIPVLAPEAISEVITITQTLLSNAALSLWEQRLVATPGSWT